MSSPTKAIGKAVVLPVHVLRYLAKSPVLTGSLWYLLTRAPADVRERFLGPLRPYLLAKNADARLKKAVTLLRILFVLGVQSTLSQLLNRLAHNYWYLRRPGAPWRFGDAQKSELIVITGGCSGFGYEMVKEFAGKARIIVLDISDMPADLAGCESTEAAQLKWCALTSEQCRMCITTNAMSRTLTACSK